MNRQRKGQIVVVVLVSLLVQSLWAFAVYHDVPSEFPESTISEQYTDSDLHLVASYLEADSHEHEHEHATTDGIECHCYAAICMFVPFAPITLNVIHHDWSITPYLNRYRSVSLHPLHKPPVYSRFLLPV